MRVTPSLVFTLCIAVIAAGMVYTSRDWPLGTGLFPRSVGVPVLVMSLIQLIIDAYRSLKTSGGQRPPAGNRRPPGRLDHVHGRGGGDPGPDLCRMAPGHVLRHPAALGFFITVPLFTLLYLKYQAKEGWAVTLGFTAGMLVFFVGVFDQILHIHWLEPVISAPESFLKAMMPWLG